MWTRTKLIRVVCLVVIAFAQARLAYANSWDLDCSMSCSMTVRSFNCSFQDVSGPSSVCNWLDCLYVGECCASPEPAVASFAMNEICQQFATNWGGSGWSMNMTSCGVDTEYGTCSSPGAGNYLRASGSFYCSFTDNNCI
jgi:hypothetical protein